MTMDRHFKRLRPLPGEDGYGCHWIGTAIAAGSSILGGLMGGDAADEATDAQREALAQQLALQREMYQQQREDIRPWRETGGRALNRLEYLMGLTPEEGAATQAPAAEGPAPSAARRSELLRQIQAAEMAAGGGGVNTDIGPSGAAAPDMRVVDRLRGELAALGATPPQAPAPTGTLDTSDPAFGSLMRDFSEEDFRADPGYQFRMDEGEKALNRAAAARGMWGNPATVKELQRFSGGLADQTYNQAFDRYNIENTNRFNRLAALSGSGQTAANQSMAAAQNFGSMGGQTLENMGAAQAAGIIGGQNALIQGLTGAGAGIGNQAAFNRGLQGGQGYNIGTTSPAPWGGGGMSRGSVGAFGYRP